jgi:hypothetical protein
VEFYAVRNILVQKSHLYKNNALRLIYQLFEMGKRPSAAPKIGMRESSLCIPFIAAIIYVEIL